MFQSQNIADAEIYGAELKAGVDFGELSAALAGWSLNGAVAWSRGQDKTEDVPLESIDPLRGTLGVAFDRDAWGVELLGTFAKRKDRMASATAFRPAGYGVLDWWRTGTSRPAPRSTSACSTSATAATSITQRSPPRWPPAAR